jgi:hypothetical protein
MFVDFYCGYYVNAVALHGKVKTTHASEQAHGC